jgi:hypothetical protein
VLLGEGDKAISAQPVERCSGRLHDLPLHLVSRSDDRELARNDGLVRGVIEVKGMTAVPMRRPGFAASTRSESGAAAMPEPVTALAAVVMPSAAAPGCIHCEKTTDPHVLPPLRHQVTLVSFESFGHDYRNRTKLRLRKPHVNSSAHQWQCYLWILMFPASGWIASDSCDSQHE